MILIKIPFKVANKFNDSRLERLKTLKRIFLKNTHSSFGSKTNGNDLTLLQFFANFEKDQ